MKELTEAHAELLAGAGFTALAGPFAAADEAFAAAASVIADTAAGEPDLPAPEVIGDFVIPPPDGPPSRDFQTLHFDFGLPVDPSGPGDVARYTALHIPAGRESSAQTRLVPLGALLGQVAWPDRDELLARLIAYGDEYGGRADLEGYVEGSFARVVEGVAGGEPRLPSIKADPDFLCGNEFASLAAELDFFDAHGLSVADAQLEITIEPGAVAIFDNLALAHGRRGRRQPGELLQRVFGHRALDVGRQRLLRDRVLSAFGTSGS